MAVGTITRVKVDPHGVTAPISVGDLWMTVTTVVGSASYTTSGDALTAANLGLKTVLHTVCTVKGGATNSTGVIAVYDITNAKLLMYVAAGTEAASTTNVSGNTVTITAFGMIS